MTSRALMRGVGDVLREPWSLARTRRLLLDPSRPMWRDARILRFEVPIDPVAARRWLPPALRVPREPSATLFVADYPDTSFGVSYREAGVLVHGLWRSEAVVHCAWIVVDDDTALILGRELLGFPKKLAAIQVDEADGRVVARVERRGAVLFDLTAKLGPSAAKERAFPRPIVNVRGLPGVLPAVLWRMDVLSSSATADRCHEARAGTVSVRIGGSGADPLDELGIPSASVPGMWLRSDLGVPPADAGLFPEGLRPIGLVSPLWLAERLPLRTM